MNIRFWSSPIEKNACKKALEEAHAHLQAIARLRGFFEMEMDGTIRGANEIFLKLLGYSEGELVGRHHDLLSPVDANGTAVSQQFWQALRSGKSQAGQHKMLTKDGREVWLQANYNPVIIGDGQPIRIVVYSTDITKQVLEKSRMVEAVKQMDEALGAASAGNFSKRISCEHLDEDARSLGQGINQFLELLTVREKSTSQLLSETTRIRRGLDVVITNVMIADNDLNIIYANESVRQMLAAAEADIRKDLPAFRADSMLGTNIDSFHKNPAHQRRMLGEMSATHKTRLNLGGRSFSLILNPIFNESGERLGTVVEWRDITEQLAQDARDAAQVEANQALSRAVAEVRTVVAKASTGDLKQRVREDDKEGEIHTLVSGVNQVLASNDALISDITATLGEIGQGRLSVRADAERHQGGFRTMIHDINTSLDAVINPLNVAASYVDRISKGDIPAPITDSYNGDFNAIKNNLNTCISAVNALVADAGMLSTAAVEGKLATRADATKHQGDFRKIVQGVNETLDAVINPLNVAASYVDRISKGDIPAPITDSYNGDFNTIKNNLNQAIDAVNKLVSDAGMLSVAAVEGKLATRADATKHQGDFRKIVQGVNDTLDAVINPLNVAANYVDRISKGDIPAPITDSYNGDFNTIKNNLNQAIDAVNKLVADAGMLSTAAVEGKLATRADATKHRGDFRRIVQGVNETLDAVINPLNVAASYVDQISKGDIPAPITDSYNGDFNTIKNNLNTCISAVNSLVADAGMLSMAAVEGKLATRADATKHQGDFRKIVQGVNDTLDAVIGPLNVAAGYVDRISKGDIPTPITDSYNGDFNAIKNNLNQAISAVNALVTDAGMLSLAAVEGKLATRADATKHQGDFRKIVQGVNETLDAVINPLNVAANYVDRISKGDIPAPITDSYNGDFNTIKNNLNQAIDAVNKLVADAGMLSTAAVEGKLATRADASKHQGDFRRIVQGVNETLDAVINPLNVAANYVDRISKGDIPAPITDSYNGDFNTIKNNLNQAIDAVNKLVADAGMLSTAAVEGKLATRADATKHQGDFRKIVQGVNDTLDAVIGPLNVAAGYVDRISKGDIPTPITDSYNGDFNTIKNNLNQAIDAVNKLVSDAGMLSTAAVEGKLATRADASKHQGDFRRIVQGVNETLDAVINPLNVAANYVDRISKGDIPTPITDSYNGDFNTIKNNLNQAIDAVNKLVADAGMLSTAAVEGKLATRADATKHQGDFRKIVQGVNETLDAVINPLNVAANYVDRISKGDIPTPITDSYNGDFNTIKNNLNQAISAVNSLVSDAGMLSLAAVEGKLATRADAAKHQGDFRKIVQGVNDTLDAVIGPLNVAAGYVDRISKGDIPTPITDSYNGDFNTIKNNLNQAIDAVNKLVADAGMLSTAAVEGKLATRADATKHQGDFRKIVQGVNETLDAVINPLNVAANYVDRISKGDIPTPITDSYNGDFNTIKNNLNTCISAVDALVADAGMLSTAAVEGKLATRADAAKHQGDFRKIVQGVNDTLDAVIGPLNVAAGYVDRISKGDIPAPITDSYNGDFNTIKNNLNQAIDAVNKLVADAGMLSTAAVEGKLATRADATKHQGDFRKIVQGVNETLDAVIGPLNVAASYVDRISKGDIPVPITDSYNGDFNTIKNNLNTCISAVNSLVADAGMLSTAAVEGKLATRADANKHQGDFRKIVQGVNETLDSVIGPINDTGIVLSALAQGDLSQRIVTQYNGELGVLRDNVNTSVQSLGVIINQTAGVMAALAAGDLTTRIEGEFPGVFGKLKSDTNSSCEQVMSIISQIKSAADTIAVASREIAAGNSDLSGRTEQQAASLEETASSMEELTTTVRQNAENAKQANQLSIGASEIAVKGGDVVGQVVSTMDAISQSSKKIVDIISVIDGIAFQTNILALNAAVEAARAGEQGRGFAVVASEVRNLAQRSAGAAKEIKTLISDSVEKVGNGTKLVEHAGRTMEEIVTSVKRVTDIMGEITAASQQQSQGIEQVNQTVTQMDEVTQQNAALVEQASAAARSLESQAEGLTDAVSRFRVVMAGAAGIDKTAAQHAVRTVASAPASVPLAGTAGVRTQQRSKPVMRRSSSASEVKTASTGRAAAAAGGDEQWSEF